MSLVRTLVQSYESIDRSFAMLYGQMMTTVLHRAIRAELEARIHSGELLPGARLPTEAELQRQHGVSRATARQALNDLAQAGLAHRSRGRGSFVADGLQQVNLARLVDPRIGNAGVEGRHSILSSQVVLAAQALIALPDVDRDAAVNQLVRLKHDLAGEPIVVEVAAVPFALAPDLLDADMVHLTTREYFIARATPIVGSRTHIDAVNIDEHYAELLSVEPGTAVLRQRRAMWLANGDLAESAVYYLRPGAFEYYVEHNESAP